MGLFQDSGRKNDVVIGIDGVADTFFFNRDGNRDILEGFEQGLDRIDLSHYGVDFSLLRIVDKWDGSGVRIVIGEEKLHLPGANAKDFSAVDFIFTRPAEAAPPGPFVDRLDSMGLNDRVVGVRGVADRFVMLDDGNRDVIGRYRDGEDVIDLSDFGTSFDELKIVNKGNGKGVRIVIDDEKIFVRGADAASFTADDFIF